RLAESDTVRQMLQVAHTAGRNHRHRHRLADRTGDIQVETVLGTITIHAGQQDFAGDEIHHFFRPFHRVQPGRFAAAMGEDFPAPRFTRCTDFFRVDGYHDALGTEFCGSFTYEFRIEHGRGVDADLVGTGVEHGANIFQLADTATDGERDKYLARHFFHGVHHGVAAF